MCISVIILIICCNFDHCKQGERRLVVRPVHLNFNYWKRTEEAGCSTGLFYCVVGRWGKSVYLFLQKETWHHEQDYKQARP